MVPFLRSRSIQAAKDFANAYVNAPKRTDLLRPDALARPVSPVHWFGSNGTPEFVVPPAADAVDYGKRDASLNREPCTNSGIPVPQLS
jgi:hypothetical protein